MFYQFLVVNSLCYQRLQFPHIMARISCCTHIQCTVYTHCDIVYIHVHCLGHSPMYCFLLHCCVVFLIILNCITLYCTALPYIVLHFILYHYQKYSIVLYCISLYCIIFHCKMPKFKQYFPISVTIIPTSILHSIAQER